jgi:alpha-galactosidase/6-phospho-beta-glucosidase family protein
VLIFSTEGDGMWHLYYEEALAEALLHPLPTRAQVERGCRAAARARAEGDRAFRAWLDRDLDDAFRRPQAEKDWVFQRQDEDIFVRILRGVAGTQPVHIVASRPNDGALAGIKSETVVEYSMTLQGRTLRPAGSYVLPDSVHGLIGALATHQTLLGDAIAQEDPRLLAQAFLAYPVRPYSRDLRKLTRELLAINADEIPPALANACEFL